MTTDREPEAASDDGERNSWALPVETVLRQDRELYEPQHVPRWWSVRKWIAASHRSEGDEIDPPIGFDAADDRIVTDGGRKGVFPGE